MKRLVNFFLPFYVHNKQLTKHLTWRKKVAFLIFYIDRFVYSPLFQIIQRRKTFDGSLVCKSYWSKRIYKKWGYLFNDTVDTILNGTCTQESKERKESNEGNNYSKIKNDKEENADTSIEENVAALWPRRISYVTPLKVQRTKTYNKFNVIYIGHMSILIQTKTFNILIDPVLSQRIGICNILGIKRIIQPGITFHNLPTIDFILLSNNRYDTMDKTFLKKIILRDNSIILGGMNIRRYLFKKNFPVVYPLNWFDTVSFENISFHYLPTCTNSHRFFFDKNIYLPGSFLIQDNNGSIFYSGHTSYSNHFLQIQKYLKDSLRENERQMLDLSILPIGIYKPRGIYQPFHMSPEEAVKAHLDLNSRRSLGIGHDVFCLGGEKYGEAANELGTVLSLYEKKEKGKEKIHFVTVEPGQNLTI